MPKAEGGYDAPLYGAQFNKGMDAGSMYATAGAGSNECYVWDRNTGECLGSTGPHPGDKAYFSAQWSNDSSMIAFAGSGSEIQLFNINK